jgi:hypothetical protein
MSKFFKTYADALYLLIDAGWEIDSLYGFRRGYRTAKIRETKRGFVIDLNTVPARAA